MATKASKPRMQGAVERELLKLKNEGWKPAEIHRLLKEEFGAAGTPTLRTVQRRVRESMPKDPTDPWSLAEAAAAEAPLVLASLAAVLEHTEGRIRHLTLREAEWIVKVRRAAPSLAPFGAWRLAHEYMLRADSGDDTEDLDAYLAFAPAPDEPDESVRESAFTHARLQARLWPRRPFRVWFIDEDIFLAYLQECEPNLDFSGEANRRQLTALVERIAGGQRGVSGSGDTTLSPAQFEPTRKGAKS